MSAPLPSSAGHPSARSLLLISLWHCGPARQLLPLLSFPLPCFFPAGRPLGHYPWSRSAAPWAPFPALARSHWPVPEPPFLLEARRVWIRSTRTSSRAMRGPLRERPACRGRSTPFFLARPLSRASPQPPLPPSAPLCALAPPCHRSTEGRCRRPSSATSQSSPAPPILNR
jgi:hypothetical protein